MTAAQALSAGGSVSAHAANRTSGSKEHAAGPQDGEIAFEEVLQGEGRGEAGSMRKARAESRGEPEPRTAPDAGAHSKGEELAEGELKAVLPQTPALAQVFASFASYAADPVDLSTASVELVETPDAVISRLLDQAREAVIAESGTSSEAEVGEEVFEIKAAIEAMDVAVRGQEKHLAPVQAVNLREAAQAHTLDAREVNVAVSPAQAQKIAASLEAKTSVPGKADSLARALPRADAAELSGDAALPDVSLSGLAVDEERDGASGGTNSNAGGNNSNAGGSGGLALLGLAANHGGARIDGADTFASLLTEASPATQVATRVTTEMSGASIGGSAVKVLHLELKPENLGTVTVRVALKDEVISLHMEAQRPETALAIEREREALSTALKQAGYIVDQVTTQQADPRSLTRADGVQGASSGTLSGQDQGFSGQQFDQASQNFGNGSQRGQGSRVEDTDPALNDGRAAPLPAGSRGGIYV